MAADAFDLYSVALWFFGVFIASLAELKVAAIRKNRGEDYNWWKPLGTVFIIMLLFAEYYYPHLKASWGGGTPVNVTLYFTKDSAVKPNQMISAQLVEESDEGFYIVGTKETRAIYIPRSAIALVYFSDKITGSALLRDGK
jgi:hypothetical protein